MVGSESGPTRGPSVGPARTGFDQDGPAAYGAPERPMPPADTTPDQLRTVADLSDALAASIRPMLVGLAGGVASGKSTTAERLRSILVEQLRLDTEVVSTDGFLLDNARLDELGIMHRKGFPESYDQSAIEEFLRRVRTGAPAIVVPLYDHLLHDVLPEVRIIDPVPVVILEGVNALQFADRLDLGIHIHAEEPDMRAWYLERLLGLRHRSTTEPSAFFAAFASLSDAQFTAQAEAIWEAVNLRNLTEHIEPASLGADVIITKRSDHSIESILLR